MCRHCGIAGLSWRQQGTLTSGHAAHNVSMLSVIGFSGAVHTIVRLRGPGRRDGREAQQGSREQQVRACLGARAVRITGESNWDQPPQQQAQPVSGELDAFPHPAQGLPPHGFPPST